MSRFLKGTYALPGQDGPDTPDPEPTAEESDSDRIARELRDRALASISGSMVYVERTALSWDGDEQSGGNDDDVGER